MLLIHSAIVISREGLVVDGKLVVVFQVNGFSTQPGQSLAIIGSCDELGHWDHSFAYRIEHVNSNTWIATVAFNLKSLQF